ncbi:hypothetical protein V1290_005378 [Bradyrhizobium sp. AZCC 1578]
MSCLETKFSNAPRFRMILAYLSNRSDHSLLITGNKTLD